MMRDYSTNFTNYFDSSESDFEKSYVSQRKKIFEAESSSNSNLYELHQNNKLQLRKEKINEIICEKRFQSYDLEVDENLIPLKFQNIKNLKELNELIKYDENYYNDSKIIDLLIDLLKRQIDNLSIENSLSNLIFIYKYLIINLYSSLLNIENKDLLKEQEENHVAMCLKTINKQTLCLNDLITINPDCFEVYFTNKAMNNKMKKLQKVITNFSKLELDYPEFNTCVFEIKTNCLDITSNILSIIKASTPMELIEHLIQDLREITIGNRLCSTYISAIIAFLSTVTANFEDKEYKEIALQIITNILTKIKSPRIKYECLYVLLDLVKSNDFILLTILNKNSHNLIEILFSLIGNSLVMYQSIEDLFYPSISILSKFLINKDTSEIFLNKFPITGFLMNCLKNVDIIQNKMAVTSIVHFLFLGFTANEVKNIKIDFVTNLDQIISITSWKDMIEDILNIYNIILANCTLELYDEILGCDMIKTIVDLIDNEVALNKHDSFIVLCVLVLFETFIKNDHCYKFKKKLKKLHLIDDIDSILSILYNKCQNKSIQEKVTVLISYLEIKK